MEENKSKEIVSAHDLEDEDIDADWASIRHIFKNIPESQTSDKFLRAVMNRIETEDLTTFAWKEMFDLNWLFSGGVVSCAVVLWLFFLAPINLRLISSDEGLEEELIVSIVYGGGLNSENEHISDLIVDLEDGS